MNNYIVTKSTKSIGIGMILLLIFGPFGMFYATIFGTLIMLLMLIPLTIICLAIPIFIFILVPFYYLICAIWLMFSINSYNKRILKNSFLQNNNYEINISYDRSIFDLKQDLYKLKSLRNSNVITEEIYNQQANRLLREIDGK